MTARLFLRLLPGLIALLFAVPAAAQTYDVVSVANVNLGQIAAGASGTTRFQVHPASGSLTKLSGAGARVSGGSGRVLVTVTCTQQAACNKKNSQITITATGAPTKRFAALENLTVSTVGGTAVLASPPSTAGSTITFSLGPIIRNATATFYVGYDLVVYGDNSGLPTGLSAAGLSVTIAKENGQDPAMQSGTVSGTVFRTLTTSVTANLAFGLVSRPRQGTGSVSLSPSQSSVVTTGDGVVAPSPSAPHPAAISVTGEGGQTLSVSIPGTFAMTGPSGSITVTTIPSLSGSTVLPGSLGSAGSASVKVGGSFPLTADTPTGSYSGSFSVVFQYN